MGVDIRGSAERHFDNEYYRKEAEQALIHVNHEPYFTPNLKFNTAMA